MNDEARTNGNGMEEGAGAGQSRQEPGAAPSSIPQPERRDSDKRLVIVGGHLLVALLVLSMWAAADTWQAVTGFALASLLSVLTAFLAGFVLGTLVHEWGHFLGARRAGASYTIPGKPGLFVFNFDFARNSPSQFLTMSHGGQLGGALAVLLLWLAVPTDTAGRAMLVAAAGGAAVFAAAIEWPVIRAVRAGGDPATELGRIDRAVLQGSALKGLGATAAFWLMVHFL
jgi:hypothetical protein